MYPLKPLKVYAHESVRGDELCMNRIENVLGGIGRSTDELVWIDENNLPEIVQELSELWPPQEEPDDVPVTFTRPLVFTRMYLGEGDPTEESVGWPKDTDEGMANAIVGNFKPIQAYHPYEKDQVEDRVCWPTWDFATMMGCPHGCHYCGHGKNGKFITLAANVEDFVETVVPRAFAKYPWQKCFRLQGWSAEQAAFEPEYGAYDLITRTMAEHDRYVYFHSAGSYVEWLEEIEHRDRVIGIFSMSAPRTSAAYEPGAGEPLERFDAGGKCNEMGVPVRYKFKPMIPIDGWREDYAKSIKHALEVSQPESIGFCVIMWMSLEELGRRIDISKLDPEYVQAARDAADEMEGNVCAPFPHHVRKEIYEWFIDEIRKYDEDVKLFISTESREMWDELAEKLGQDPDTFFCGCSSVAPPGGKVELSAGCPHSTYSPLVATAK